MLRNLVIQLAILVIVFNIISFVREMNMLQDDNLASTKVFQLETLMADKVTIGQHEKTTVLYFFAPWCSICHASIDNLQALYLKNPHIEVIAIALDYQSRQAVVDFSQQHQLTFPIALGHNQLKQAYKINGYPSYYVIGENNQITGKSLGYSTELGLYLRTL